jgi:hypothetical protein
MPPKKTFSPEQSYTCLQPIKKRPWLGWKSTCSLPSEGDYKATGPQRVKGPWRGVIGTSRLRITKFAGIQWRARHTSELHAHMLGWFKEQ